MSKKRSHFPQKFPAGLSKLTSTFPRDCFEVLFREIFILFITFGLCAEKQIRFWPKAFARIVEMLRVLGNILGRNFCFEKTKTISFRLPHFERILFGLLAETIQQGCQNRSLRLEEKVLMIFLGKKTLVSSFPFLICRCLSNSFSKMFGKLMENAIWVFRETIWGKLICGEV